MFGTKQIRTFERFSFSKLTSQNDFSTKSFHKLPNLEAHLNLKRIGAVEPLRLSWRKANERLEMSAILLERRKAMAISVLDGQFEFEPI